MLITSNQLIYFFTWEEMYYCCLKAVSGRQQGVQDGWKVENHTYVSYKKILEKERRNHVAWRHLREVVIGKATGQNRLWSNEHSTHTGPSWHTKPGTTMAGKGLSFQSKVRAGWGAQTHLWILSEGVLYGLRWLEVPRELAEAVRTLRSAEGRHVVYLSPPHWSARRSLLRHSSYWLLSLPCTPKTKNESALPRSVEVLCCVNAWRRGFCTDCVTERGVGNSWVPGDSASQAAETLNVLSAGEWTPGGLCTHSVEWTVSYVVCVLEWAGYAGTGSSLTAVNQLDHLGTAKD